MLEFDHTSLIDINKKSHAKKTAEMKMLASSFHRTFTSQDAKIILDHLRQKIADQVSFDWENPNTQQALHRAFAIEGQKSVLKYIDELINYNENND